MKTTINLLAGIIFLLNTSFANEAKYNLYVTNVNMTSEKTLEFDIYLVNPSKEELKYAMGQYFLDINPEVAKSGELTYSIVSSDLPESMRPSSSAVSGNQLRLSVNRINTNTETLPVIPASKPGLLIARMKLETSANQFATKNIDLKWSDSEKGFRTKIVTFAENKMVEVTDSKNHLIESDNTGTGAVENIAELPTEYSLSQNYPNPFNPSTVISFSMVENGFVNLKVYDISGKEILTLVNESKNAGRYEVKFDGSRFASGVYFYKITAGNFSAVKRMFLIK